MATYDVAINIWRALRAGWCCGAGALLSAADVAGSEDSAVAALARCLHMGGADIRCLIGHRVTLGRGLHSSTSTRAEPLYHKKSEI